MTPPPSTLFEIVPRGPQRPQNLLPRHRACDVPWRQGAVPSRTDPRPPGRRDAGLAGTVLRGDRQRPKSAKDHLLAFLEHSLLATRERQLGLERWTVRLARGGHRQEAGYCANAAYLIRTGPASQLADLVQRVRLLPQDVVTFPPDPEAWGIEEAAGQWTVSAIGDSAPGPGTDGMRRQADAAILLSQRCVESARRVLETSAPGSLAGEENSASEWTTAAEGEGAAGRMEDSEIWQHLDVEQRQSRKLEALGTLAGGIAHDFNNILTAILSFAELSRMENPDNPGLQENLRQILLAGNRAAGLVRRILSFSRKQKAERRPVQLGGVVHEALELLRSTLPSTLVICEESEPGLPDVLADPTQIHQVMINLATNAAHAMRGRQGRLTVELRLAPCAGRITTPQAELRSIDYVHMILRDTGDGMDQATLRRLFEPFFTTKPPGEGTGLGLAMVHAIIQEHEGVIRVCSEVGVGTTFHVYLPSVKTVQETRVDPTTEVPRGHGERILLVDDESAVCEATARLLEHLGYQVVSCRDPEEAREVFQRDAARFHAVVTDLTMPGRTGLELARALLGARSEVPVILCSGHSGAALRETVQQLGIREVLQKPIERTVLALALHRALHPPA